MDAPASLSPTRISKGMSTSGFCCASHHATSRRSAAALGSFTFHSSAARSTSFPTAAQTVWICPAVSGTGSARTGKNPQQTRRGRLRIMDPLVLPRSDTSRGRASGAEGPPPFGALFPALSLRARRHRRPRRSARAARDADRRHAGRTARLRTGLRGRPGRRIPRAGGGQRRTAPRARAAVTKVRSAITSCAATPRADCRHRQPDGTPRACRRPRRRTPRSTRTPCARP